jgi:arylsulfatase A-like enzyme
MMEAEEIGKDQAPDLVTLFLSSMDLYSGEFGPSSMETEDLYLRLDQEIGEIVDYLENKFGKDRFLLYLTANTSASYPVKILKERYRIPAGYFNPESAHALLNTYLHATFGDLRWTEYVSSSQVYLNMRLTGINNVKPSEILDKSAEFLSRFEGIRLAVTSDMIRQNILPEDLSTTIIRSYCPGRSGDLLFLLRDGWQPLKNKMKVPYTDQQKLPLIFYGSGIFPGTDRTPHQATDLAPTISAVLGIQTPVSGEGKAIDLLRGVKQ